MEPPPPGNYDMASIGLGGFVSSRGGPFGPPLFERPVAKKFMRLKNFGKICHSMEIV
jgi:hypothetical protein